jgi:hypothetical protein
MMLLVTEPGHQMINLMHAVPTQLHLGHPKGNDFHQKIFPAEISFQLQ